MKTCPFCAEEIQDAAIKCKHCGELLGGPQIGSAPDVPSVFRNGAESALRQLLGRIRTLDRRKAMAAGAVLLVLLVCLVAGRMHQVELARAEQERTAEAARVHQVELATERERTADIAVLRERLAPFEKLASASVVGIKLFQLQEGLQGAQFGLDRLRQDQMTQLEDERVKLVTRLDRATSLYKDALEAWGLTNTISATMQSFAGESDMFEDSLGEIDAMHHKIEDLLKHNGLPYSQGSSRETQEIIRRKDSIANTYNYGKDEYIFGPGIERADYILKLWNLSEALGHSRKQDPKYTNDPVPIMLAAAAKEVAKAREIIAK